MVMKTMLIGLLVIGAVAMLETDVSAGCDNCGGWCCCWFPGDRKRLLEEVKKHGSRQVLIVDDDPMSPKTLKVREMLIQDGLPPETIGELILDGRTPLILEGRTPPMYTRKGQLVLVEIPEKPAKSQ